jgi:hypothetical protein
MRCSVCKKPKKLGDFVDYEAYVIRFYVPSITYSLQMGALTLKETEQIQVCQK